MTSRGYARTRLSTRFLVYYAIAYLILIGLMGVIVDRVARATLLEDVDDDLVVAARLAAESLGADSVGLREWASDASAAGGIRITLIDSDGTVRADSQSDAASMENHGDRPEVAAALGGEVGMAQRLSESTGTEQRYVAIPAAEGMVVRTSLPTGIIDEQLGKVRRSIALTAAVLGLLGVLAVALLGRRISRPIVELTRQARAVAAGDVKVDPLRSPVRELDQLGVAIAAIAADLGTRVDDAERANATLGVVLGSLPEGTVLIDARDTVAYSNPTARHMLGAVPEVLSRLSPVPFQEIVRNSRTSGHTQTVTADHGLPNRRLTGTATPFAGEGRVLLLIADVTERERTDSVRRDFVANASHELKTPVSTIIASSEALQISLQREDGAAPTFAERIEVTARRLDRLVGDLLDLSRLEAETPETAPVRIDHMLREEVERVRDDAKVKEIELGLETVELTVDGNHRNLATAVRNLLDNAIRYTPAGGTVTATVARDGPWAVVTVSDSGEGIPTREIERIFERFYRVDSARSRDTGGTGLGLSIVKHVVEGHGGSVSVTSTLGSGSTFTVRLPGPMEGGSARRN
jgi:two-component system phosphate regulon sensor histidine kinase PhoR